MTVEALNIEGFKAAQLADQAQPMLDWVDLEKLVINREYQRSITAAGRRAIQKIADGFSWQKYQPILIAPHEGGRFAIVDGQHRAHAALLCGIQSLPAMVVPMTLCEQALGFAAINRDQIRIDNCALYRAELAAGTEWAVHCRDTVKAAGCDLATSMASHLSKKPGKVFAISLIRRMCADGEAEAVTAGLSGIRNSLCGEERESYGGPVLAVWLPSIAANQRFLKLDLAAAFEDISVVELLDRARIEARLRSRPARALAIEWTTQHLRGLLDA